MKVRSLKQDDYNTLKEWWSFWRFPAPSLFILPDYGLGGIMIQNDDNEDLACGFIYDTNSHIAWVEYIVSNPKANKKDREEGVLKLLEELSLECSKRGYKVIFSSLKHEGLINKYIQSGFEIGTKGTSELIKLI